MAKHVYPPFGVGVADSSSVHLTLDVSRVITAFTLFAGSGGDFGVSAIPARSDHTHITSYDGRYVLKAGDTMTGNLNIQKANPFVNLIDNTGGNPQFTFYDTTDGGGVLFSQDGAVYLARVNTAGSWIGNAVSIDKITGSIGLLAATTISNALTVSAGGAAITGNVTLTSGVFSTTAKGSLFGASSGVNTALTQANAAIMFYANAANNWAGMGADSSGGVWLRTGLSGTPDYRVYWDNAGVMTQSGPAGFGSNVSVTGQLIVSGGLFVTRNTGNAYIDTPSTGQQGELWFASAGAAKWALYKTTTNDLAIWNVAASRAEITLPAAGGARFVSLSGGGNLSVSTDTNGQLIASSFSGVGSSLVLLATNTPSGVASSSFSSLFSATYDEYFITFRLTRSANAVVGIRVRLVSTDLSTASYTWNGDSQVSSATTITGANSNSDTNVVVATATGTTSDVITGIIKVSGPFLSDYTFFDTTMIGRFTTGSFKQRYSGMVNNTTSYDGITVFAASGTITGTMRLYGARNS